MKTLEGMIRDFELMCCNQPCEACKYEKLKTRTDCIAAYVYDQFVEKRLGTETDDSAPPATADKMEAVQMPAWVKPGAYVVNRAAFERGRGWVMHISKVREDGSIYAWRCSKMEGCSGPWQEFAPVKFVPYTYEEATKLIGERMEYSREAGHRVKRMITDVEEEGGCLFISGYTQDFLQYIGTKVNGVPFGKVVIDEEAMKGGEE